MLPGEAHRRVRGPDPPCPASPVCAWTAPGSNWQTGPSAAGRLQMEQSGIMVPGGGLKAHCLGLNPPSAPYLSAPLHLLLFWLVLC